MSHTQDTPRQHQDTLETSKPIIWADQQGVSWQVELAAQHIRLHRDGEVFTVPASAWPTDVYVTQHRGDAVIRFETFDKSLVFVLPMAAAQPLLNLVGSVATTQFDRDQEKELVPSDRPRAVLWPNVSRLAVWALGCSALAFLPVIGPLFATGVLILVLRHRRTVRSSPAWDHSRIMCRIAVILTLVGLLVCALATAGLLKQKTLDSREPLQAFREPQPVDGAHGIAETEAEFETVTEARAWQQIQAQRSVLRATSHAESRGLREYLDHGSQQDNPSPQAESPLRLPLTRLWIDSQPREAFARLPASAALAASGMPWEGDHNWGLILAGLVVLLLSLSVHEAAHAITAWWLGDDFGKRLGRVTLNPMAHIDPLGTVLLPLILFLAGAGVFGWAKPVPVRTELLRNPRHDHILIAAAGPASNVLLAAISLMLLLGIVCSISLFAPGAEITNLITGAFTDTVKVSGIPAATLVGGLCTVLQLSFILNLFLACFNLIPIPPLDGSWILEHTFPMTLGPLYAKIRPYGFIVFLLAFYSGALDVVLGAVMYVLWPGMWLLVNCSSI